MPLGMEVGFNPGDFSVRRGPSHPPQKGGRAPQFSIHVYCGQTAAWIKMPLGTEVGLGPDNIVLDVDPATLLQKGAPPNFRLMSIVAKRLDRSRWHLAWRRDLVQATLCSMVTQPPPQKRGQSPHQQFSAHFCCGQTAGCIKVPIGMEVGLSPGDFVLHGNPSRRFVCTLVTWCKKALYKYSSFPFFPKNGRSPPIFGSRLLWPNGCIGHDNTWYRGRHWSTRHCVR